MVSKQAVNQVAKHLLKKGGAGGLVGALLDGFANKKKGLTHEESETQTEQAPNNKTPNNQVPNNQAPAANDSANNQAKLARDAVKGLAGLFGR